MTMAAALFVGAALGAFACDDDRPLPPVLGTLPAFELTDHRGEPFGSDQLRGHAWVANFIFTRCPTVCPVFTQRMAQLREAFAEQDASVQLVSFSVDPDYDTPQVLATYAKARDAEASNWSFLTGPWEQIRATVHDGMKVSMEQQGMTGDVPDIIHGTHFVLVDPQLRIRGYYASDDPEAVKDLRADAMALGRHRAGVARKRGRPSNQAAGGAALGELLGER